MDCKKSVFPPVLPEVYNETLSYEEQICLLYDYVKNYKQDNTYNNTFIFNDTNALADAQIPKKLIRSYSYDDMVRDMDILCTNYPKIRRKSLGLSVLGLNLWCLEYGTENATRHLFVFNGFHGNEASSSIALSQLEVLVKNEVYGGINLWNEILNNDTCIHVIPMANPDAWQLGLYGFDYFPNMTEEQKTFIAGFVEDYIRNYAKDEKDGSNWDIPTRANLEEYIRSLGGDPSVSYEAYVFRQEDLHVWEANVNGIDLHYNWYTDGMKKTVDLALENINHGHPNAYVYGAQGSRAYLDENNIYYNYIRSFENENSYFNFLNYHQKGPTNIWNYRLEGLQNNRNFDCGNKLCELMQVPYSAYVGKQSTPIGFTAWGGINYKNPYTLSFTIEVGWSYSKLRGDWWNDTLTGEPQRSPVPDSQWENIYISNKAVYIWFIRYYTSFRDVWDRHQYLSEYNIKDKITDERFAIPSMALIRSIANKVGSIYSSLNDLGLTATATLQDVLNKLNFQDSLTMGVTSSLTISNDLPFWSYSKTGYLDIYPITPSSMVIDFYVRKTNYLYRKIYYTDGSFTDWVNMTPITTDYKSLDVTDGIPNATIEQLASKVNIYQTLIIDLDKNKNNIIGIPEEVGTNYRLEITGKRPNNRITITDIRSGNIYINNYSRTNGTVGNWYKIQAVPL